MVHATCLAQVVDFDGQSLLHTHATLKTLTLKP